MARKAKNLYEVFVRKEGTSETKDTTARPGRKKPAKRKRSTTLANGFGDRKLDFSLSLNGLVGLVLVGAIFLGGMYALGRYTNTGTVKAAMTSTQGKQYFSPFTVPNGEQELWQTWLHGEGIKGIEFQPCADNNKQVRLLIPLFSVQDLKKKLVDLPEYNSEVGKVFTADSLNKLGKVITK